MIKRNKHNKYPFSEESFFYEDLEFKCSGTIIPATNGSFYEPAIDDYIEDLSVYLEADKKLLNYPGFNGPTYLDVTWHLPDWLIDLIEETLLEDLAWQI